MDPTKEREIKQAVAQSGRGFFLILALGIFLVLGSLLLTEWPRWIVWPLGVVVGTVVGALLYLPLQMSGVLAKGFWFSFFKRN